MLRSRRTVRMRLTVLYCVLFVLSSVALLAIAAITNAGQGGAPTYSPEVPVHSAISRYLRSSVITLVRRRWSRWCWAGSSRAGCSARCAR